MDEESNGNAYIAVLFLVVEFAASMKWWWRGGRSAFAFGLIVWRNTSIIIYIANSGLQRRAGDHASLTPL
jgi:hypothetical protein